MLITCISVARSSFLRPTGDTVFKRAITGSGGNHNPTWWEGWIRDGWDKTLHTFPSFRLKGIFSNVEPNTPPVSSPQHLRDTILIGWVTDDQVGAKIETRDFGSRWSEPGLDHEFDHEEYTADIDFAGLPFDIFEADARCKQAGFNDPYMSIGLRGDSYTFYTDETTAGSWEIELATGDVRRIENSQNVANVTINK